MERNLLFCISLYISVRIHTYKIPDRVCGDIDQPDRLKESALLYSILPATMETIIDGTQLFNTSDIKYAYRLLNNGSKAVGVRNSKAGTNLRITTPPMKTWGASDFEGNKKFDLSLRFEKETHTAEVQTFLENMQNLEEKIKEDAMKNSN